MEYPLKLSFKLLSIASTISLTDPSGKLVFFIKQKAFKLKEDITIFSDKTMTQPQYFIKTENIIDFNSLYTFSDSEGKSIGALKRKGMKSLLKARYDIMVNDQVLLTISEKNPWIRVLDALFSSIPFVGILSAYIFNPSYSIKRIDNTELVQLKKQPALFEGRFVIEKLNEFTPSEETPALLGLILMIILERGRG